MRASSIQQPGKPTGLSPKEQSASVVSADAKKRLAADAAFVQLTARVGRVMVVVGAVADDERLLLAVTSDSRRSAVVGRATLVKIASQCVVV